MGNEPTGRGFLNVLRSYDKDVENQDARCCANGPQRLGSRWLTVVVRFASKWNDERNTRPQEGPRTGMTAKTRAMQYDEWTSPISNTQKMRYDFEHTWRGRVEFSLGRQQ